MPGISEQNDPISRIGAVLATSDSKNSMVFSTSQLFAVSPMWSNISLAGKFTACIFTRKELKTRFASSARAVKMSALFFRTDKAINDFCLFPRPKDVTPRSRDDKRASVSMLGYAFNFSMASLRL